MIKLLEEKKEANRKNTVREMLARLKEGTVIVEGKHDLKTLNAFGISALTQNTLEYRRAAIEKNMRVYIMTDNDRRGIERSDRITSFLYSINKDYKIDVLLGRRLQKMTNSTSVEQLAAPIKEILDGNNGKNIS